MIWISDEAIARLGSLPDEVPDFSGTRYRLSEELDRGGMGVVWAADDDVLGRSVAIKVLRGGLLCADAADRLERESRILAALEHPGVVPVHDAGTLPDGRSWYVMKRVRGRTVDEVVRSDISLADSLRLFARICEPVAFAHSRGVVHRDLKPENVMVGEFGEVLVMDWGVATLLRDRQAAAPDAGLRDRDEPGTEMRAPLDGGRRLTADGDVIGTRGYMAPEQERGEIDSIGPQADVWALGAMLRELAVAASAREGRPVPKPLRAIVERATATSPSDRYDSAEALATDVVRFADGVPVSAYREAVWERVLRWTRANRAAVAVVAAYLVMRTILYLWLGR